MGKILLTWELGSGLGHLLPLRVLGRALVERGHHVTLALRPISEASEVFAQTGVAITRAPLPSKPPPRPFPKVGGYAHILANVGFDDVACLSEFVDRWNHLFDQVKPDLVVADHSPMALLALRGRPIRVTTIGTGFCSPPDGFPLPFWTPTGHLPARLKMMDDERQLLANTNAILRRNRRPLLEWMGQLFNQVEEVILTTYKELDPFAPRNEPTRYWGHWHADGGIEPAWPEGEGPKVFAYLKPMKALDTLMEVLKKAGVRSLIVAGSHAGSLRQRHVATNLRFEKDAVNLPKCVHQCDLAITNAGHGTLATILLAGKPVLLFPLFMEQLLNAQAVVNLGACKQSSAGAALPQVAAALKEMLSVEGYAKTALAFAARYAGFEPGQQLPDLADRLGPIHRQ